MLNRKPYNLLYICVLIFSEFMTSFCNSSENDLRARTVAFPVTYSIGRVFAIDANEMLEEYSQTPLLELGPAQGDVKVPVGKSLMLMYFMPAQEGNDVDLSPLDTLGPTDIQFIGIPFVNVLPGELKRLERFSELRGIDFAECKFDDQCLNVLSGFSNLQHLGISETQVTDIDIQSLSKLSGLRFLDLYNIKLSHVSLEVVSRLRNLRYLRLGSKKMIPDNGLQCLKTLTQLKVLELYGSDINDNDLIYLKQMKKLERLNLQGASITDEGLEHLYALQNLKWIGLMGTGVTDKGVDALKQAIPKLTHIDQGRGHVVFTETSSSQPALTLQITPEP